MTIYSRRMATAMMVALLVGIAAAAPARADVIVSLGDSYSSGEGAPDRSLQTCRRGACTPPWDKGTGPKCHRSRFAWPRLLGVTREHHFACSGAKIEDVLTRGRAGHPDDVPQIDRLRRLDEQIDIDTVLLTIGGNDMDFSGKIRSCFIPIRQCLRDVDKLNRQLDALEPRLRQVYNDVADATWGSLVVVGYPDIIPGRGKRFLNCDWITNKEKVGMRAFQDGLDRVIAQAAEEADVDYIPIRDALEGHELCTKDSWMNKISAQGGSERGHPTARGQREIKKKVAHGLDRLDSAAAASHAVALALPALPSGAARPPGFEAHLIAEGVAEQVAPECWKTNGVLQCAVYGVPPPPHAKCDFGGAVTSVRLRARGGARRTFVCVDEGFHDWKVLRPGGRWRSRPFRCRHSWIGEGLGRRTQLECRNRTQDRFRIDGLGRIKAVAAAAPRRCDEPVLDFVLAAFAGVTQASGMSCHAATSVLRRYGDDPQGDQFTEGARFELGPFSCRVLKQAGPEYWKARCSSGRKWFRVEYGA